MRTELPIGQLDEALRATLAPLGVGRASRAAVQTFREYLSATGVAWDGIFDPAVGIESCALAIRLPGRSAVIILPNTDPPRYASSLADLCARLRSAGLSFVQALVEPGAHTKRVALEAAGFGRATELVYLERDPTYPWVDAPGDRTTWVGYSPAAHPRFRAVIERSYADSADCPELTALRDADDAIASHRASGISGDELWELLSVDGRDVGVLLLSAIAGARAVEVSYMGLIPEVRRRGHGELLLRRALDRARVRGAKLITIVVDERNAAARRLYERLGFCAVATRDAYLLVCQNDAPRASRRCG